MGMLNTAFFWLSPLFGLGILCGFLAYELNQCEVIEDGAYNDILGHVVGMIVGGIVWLGVTL